MSALALGLQSGAWGARDLGRSRSLTLTLGLLTLGLFSLSAGHAVGAASCREAPAPLPRLAQALERAERAQRWRQIAEEAEEAEALLQSEEAPAPALRCAASLAAEAYFFLSDEREARALMSLKGLAASLRLLSYGGGDAQLRLRLKTLWRRLSEALGEREGWLSEGSPRWVEVPARARPLTLTLSPPEDFPWGEVCGLSQACRAAPTLPIPLAAGAPLKLLLAPGAYQLRWQGPCVESQGAWTLSQSEPATSPTFTLPDQRCRSRLQAYDHRGPITELRAQSLEGETLPIDRLIEGQQVRVDAPGYRPQVVEVPAEGAPMTLRLRRCAGPLKTDFDPADATVKGGRRLIWGEANRVRVSRPGYVTWEGLVTPPRPRQCPPPAAPLRVRLRREAALSILPPPGMDRVELSARVDGFPISPKGFERAPGRYQLSVEAEGLIPLVREVEVPPCATSICPPLDFSVTLQNVHEEALAYPLHMTYTGAGIMTLGLLYGVKQWYQRELYIQSTSEAERAALRDRALSGSRAASALTWTGLALTLTGAALNIWASP